MKKIKRKKYTYEELSNIGQKYYHDTNFCTVIATSVAAQVSFGKARNWLEQHGRKHKKGAYDHQYHEVMKKLGCTLKGVCLSGLPRTVGALSRQLNKGTYLVQIRHHVLVIDEGQVMDWTGQGSRHRVKMVYKITRNF